MATCVSSDFRDFGTAGPDVTGPGTAGAGAGIFRAAVAIGLASG
jgi:hypothetical protein